MKKAINQIKNRTKLNLSFIKQIEEIENLYKNSKKLLIKLANTKHSMHLTKFAQAEVIFQAICNINELILLGLKGSMFYATDPLVRVSIEHSVNIIYILEDKTNLRSRQFIKNYIETTLTKSKDWLEYAIRSGNNEEIAVAQKKFDYIREVKSQNINLFEEKIGGWPKPREKFALCGFEGAYRTIYSMNSDSIHSLSEDVYNALIEFQAPNALLPHLQKLSSSYNCSLAIYHCIKSLAFFCLAMQALANASENKVVHDEVGEVLIKVDQLLYPHEMDTIQMWS
ncbi:DUF5677 domain-containing protein [Vogesella indigofera]|uniref:DUF5677 domain-containing protein n=1 Tax=Vogesella indigofera TaxID=45465 RepID=UPI00234EED89|nr:DUF5677 domain-containing protein [Vogesella indigofera]MDC7709345.1 DUF5677 domain-containing protein [Vogesella indigofera]